MRKQNEGLGHSDSRKRVNSIFEQEEALSKAFEIGNFYTNQRLNIAELKQRLEQFKKTQKHPPGSKQYETPQKQQLPLFKQIVSEDNQNEQKQDPSTAKFVNSSSRNMKEPIPSISLNKKNTSGEGARQTINLNGMDRVYSIERKEEARQANYRIVREIQKSRYQPKVRTAYGSRHDQSIGPLHNVSIHNRLNTKKKNSIEKTEESKYSDSSHRRSWSQFGYEGRIKVESTQHLNELQKQIHHLWQHYQLLTKVLLGLRDGSRQQKNTIVKYVEDICSDRFQFIRDLLNNIQRENSSKTEAAYMKRVRKATILSKLYQNLSLVYVSLDICLKMQPDSHLVNFVGYCSSNVIFLLRLVQLSHHLAEGLNYSVHTENILAVITEFEQESYKTKIERMGDLILRIEHNNEVIGIVQQRICNKMSKEFQQIIINFLKNVDMDTKPLFQYAHYIYEFLAFHLARLNVVGQFSFVEMAPTPYLSLPKQKTLVIEPWEVLFALRGDSTYVRAYTQTLLAEVGKHWNIIYWTDLMPDKIDDLLEKLPPARILYRYHCRYQNDRFLKLLWRIGCDIDNTIIFDRQEANFKYDKEIGLQIPWNGKNKDSKLLTVLNLIVPLLGTPTISLRKSFPPVKQQFLSECKKSRQRQRGDRPIQSRNQSLLSKKHRN